MPVVDSRQQAGRGAGALRVVHSSGRGRDVDRAAARRVRAANLRSGRAGGIRDQLQLLARAGSGGIHQLGLMMHAASSTDPRSPGTHHQDEWHRLLGAERLALSERRSWRLEGGALQRCQLEAPQPARRASGYEKCARPQDASEEEVGRTAARHHAGCVRARRKQAVITDGKRRFVGPSAGAYERLAPTYGSFNEIAPSCLSSRLG
jgi:hypothetical protein